MKKTYIDKKGYPRFSNLVHRRVAYEEIYLKNRELYPLPFSKYVVHHKDGNKKNWEVDNLEILTKEEHNKLHGYVNKENKEARKSHEEVWCYEKYEPIKKRNQKDNPKLIESPPNKVVNVGFEKERGLGRGWYIIITLIIIVSLIVFTTNQVISQSIEEEKIKNISSVCGIGFGQISEHLGFNRNYWIGKPEVVFEGRSYVKYSLRKYVVLVRPLGFKESGFEWGRNKLVIKVLVNGKEVKSVICK